MQEHFRIIGSIFIGIVSIIFIYSLYIKWKKIKTKILSYILVQLLALFTINLSFILIKYIGINILPDDSFSEGSALRELFFQITVVCLFFYFRFFILVYCKLVGISPARFVKPVLNVLMFTTLLSVFFHYILTSNIFLYYQGILVLFIFMIEPLLFLITPFIKIWYKENKYKNVIRSFIKLHLGKYIFSYLILILLFIIPPYLWASKHIVFLGSRSAYNISDSFIAILSEDFSLTPREMDIISLILEGYSNKEIEDRLSISYSTVKNHLYNIYKKIGIYSRLELSSFINKRLSSQS